MPYRQEHAGSVPGQPLVWQRVVDFYHAATRVGTMSETLFGAGTPRYFARIHQMLRKLKRKTVRCQARPALGRHPGGAAPGSWGVSISQQCVICRLLDVFAVWRAPRSPPSRMWATPQFVEGTAISVATADNDWAYAKGWLKADLARTSDSRSTSEFFPESVRAFAGHSRTDSYHASGGSANHGGSSEWFLLAMAHQQLGQKEVARKWYERAVSWLVENQPQDEELRRLRAEAEVLLETKKE